MVWYVAGYVVGCRVPSEPESVRRSMHSVPFHQQVQTEMGLV